MGAEETPKIPEESAKQAAEIRSKQFRSDAQKAAALFNEKDATAQELGELFYQTLKKGGINIDEYLSAASDILRKRGDEVMKRNYEGPRT